MIFIHSLFGNSLAVENDSYLKSETLRGVTVNFVVYMPSEDHYVDAVIVSK